MIQVGVVAPVMAVRTGLRAMLQAASDSDEPQTALEVAHQAASLEEYEPFISQTDVLVGVLPKETFEARLREKNETALLVTVNFARILSARLMKADKDIAALAGRLAQRQVRKGRGYTASVQFSVFGIQSQPLAPLPLVSSSEVGNCDQEGRSPAPDCQLAEIREPVAPWPHRC